MPIKLNFSYQTYNISQKYNKLLYKYKISNTYKTISPSAKQSCIYTILYCPSTKGLIEGFNSLSTVKHCCRGSPKAVWLHLYSDITRYSIRNLQKKPFDTLFNFYK